MLRPEMNRTSHSRRLAVILAAACWPALAMEQITSVVDQNNGTLGIDFQDLAMNSAGVLAFDANTETSNQRGVFSFDPTTSTLTNFAFAPPTAPPTPSSATSRASTSTMRALSRTR